MLLKVKISLTHNPIKFISNSFIIYKPIHYYVFLIMILFINASVSQPFAETYLDSGKNTEQANDIKQNSEKLSKYPQRIISLSPNITEILFALGADKRIVAVTDFCIYPPEAKMKKKIGGLMNPNIELIVSLKPDLIIMLAANSDLKSKLSSLETKFLTVKNETISDVMESIIVIGKAVGEEKKAEELLKNFEEKLNDVKKLVEKLPKEKVLIVVDKSTDSLQGMYCAGKGNFIDEMVSIAGGINVLQDSTTPYPIASKEKLIELNPDVILDMAIYGERKEVNDKKILESWKSLYSINAVKNNRIYLVDPTSITIPGLRIPENVEHLAKLIHNLK